MNNLRLLTLICILCFAVSALAQKKIIPFHFGSDQSIILEYEIEGIKTNFFFDTGGDEGNVIDLNLGVKLGMHPDGPLSLWNNLNLEGTPELAAVPRKMYHDSILGGIWILQDMKNHVLSISAGEPLAGRVGYTRYMEESILEIDLKGQRLCLWDSLPNGYLDHYQVKKAWLIPDSRGTLITPSMMNWTTGHPYIRGEFTVLDSITYQTTFMLDSGVHGVYMVVCVKDSVLYNKMHQFRETRVQEYGDNKYSTTHLKIPELSIDTSFYKLGMASGWKGAGAMCFGTQKLGGSLGMPFFLQYDKIILDRRKKTAWFVVK